MDSNINIPKIDIDADSVTFTTTNSTSDTTIDSSSVVTLPVLNNGSWTVTTNNITIPSTIKYNCNSCKQDFEEDNFHWTTIHVNNIPHPPAPMPVHYKGKEINRHICKNCVIKAMDKLYGVDIDSESENLLYE